MDAPDEIIHQSLRLKIMSALRNEPNQAPLEFKRLKAITGATDGNLGRQITTLAEAGYVDITKDFYQNRPRTRAQISTKGIAAFDAHVAYLKSLLG
ncbi:MAG: transcriptional regulator [Alphaproteobacteria bacterium]|nr:transcriptional regulator [Alphaproteobacteria bacterium]